LLYPLSYRGIFEKQLVIIISHCLSALKIAHYQLRNLILC
jgi:hypothetical protein